MAIFHRANCQWNFQRRKTSQDSHHEEFCVWRRPPHWETSPGMCDFRWTLQDFGLAINSQVISRSMPPGGGCRDEGWCVFLFARIHLQMEEHQAWCLRVLPRLRQAWQVVTTRQVLTNQQLHSPSAGGRKKLRMFFFIGRWVRSVGPPLFLVYPLIILSHRQQCKPAQFL